MALTHNHEQKQANSGNSDSDQAQPEPLKTLPVFEQQNYDSSAHQPSLQHNRHRQLKGTNKSLLRSVAIAAALALPASVVGGVGLAKLTAGESYPQDKTEEGVFYDDPEVRVPSSIALEQRENLSRIYEVDSVAFVSQERAKRDPELNSQYQDFARNLNAFIFHEGGDNAKYSFMWKYLLPDGNSSIQMRIEAPTVKIVPGSDGEPVLIEYIRVLQGTQRVTYVEYGFDSSGTSYFEKGELRADNKKIIEESSSLPEEFIERLGKTQSSFEEGKSNVDKDTLAAQHRQITVDSTYDPDRNNTYDIFPG